MKFLADLRAEREAIGISLDILSALTDVSTPNLSKIERGLKEPSPPVVRSILTALTNLQSLRMRYDQLPLDLNDIAWLRAQIAKMNDGKDAAAIKAAGEASDSKRTKRIRPTSGKSRRASK